MRCVRVENKHTNSEHISHYQKKLVLACHFYRENLLQIDLAWLSLVIAQTNRWPVSQIPQGYWSHDLSPFQKYVKSPLKEVESPAFAGVPYKG